MSQSPQNRGQDLETLAPLVSLCKRRGFVFPSSEIYGGLNSCWDYGPLGSLLKNNIKQLWWNAMTLRDDMEGLDAAILMAPRVWEASGHIANFSDPLVDCKKCKARFRADKLEESNCPQKPSCKAGQGCGGELTEPRNFNLMFKTFMGPVEDESAVVYLRPETAQGIFVNFLNVQSTMRQKVPFGIAQIGKSFRNEITPGNFIFRMREFEQMEMQYFVRPGTDMELFEEWRQTRMKWHLETLGLRKDKLRFHEHGPDELAHYCKKAYDIQYQFPFGWSELEGIHNRTDFDLRRHQEYSGKKMEYFDAETNSKYLPFVVETAVGCDRSVLTVLADAYDEEKGETERTVMRFHPNTAPIKAAVLPLMKKEGLPEMADRIRSQLSQTWRVDFDDSGAIGKRYRRQDEIGTPFCVTVDFDSLEKQTVTVRLRDSMRQERVALDQISAFLKEHWSLEKLSEKN